MARVCVIGAGPAGVASANAASDRGASVTLLQESREIPIPRNEWPELLSRGTIQSAGVRLRSSVEFRAGECVGSLKAGRLKTARGTTLGFGAAVVATGSSPRSPVTWPKKNGVHLLDNPGAVLAAREALLQADAAIVIGTGVSALKFAEAAHELGVKTGLVSPGGLLDASFSAPVREAVRLEAARNEISLVEVKPARLVGVEKVEALIAAGTVLPCDVLLVLPKLGPRFPSMEATVGPAGGLLVDSWLRTDLPSVFAAGECAEPRAHQGAVSADHVATAKLSGFVAGCNAARLGTPYNPVGYLTFSFFGLQVSSAGMGLAQSRASGLDAKEATFKASEGGVHSVVFDGKSGAVLGVQSANRAYSVGASAMAFLISRRIRLQELAFQEASGSIDISAVAQTAREGLSSW